MLPLTSLLLLVALDCLVLAELPWTLPSPLCLVVLLLTVPLDTEAVVQALTESTL